MDEAATIQWKPIEMRGAETEREQAKQTSKRREREREREGGSEHDGRSRLNR